MYITEAMRQRVMDQMNAVPAPHYPVEFITRNRGGPKRWVVLSIYDDNIIRLAAGPFWTKRTAERIRDALNQHYRDGFDMGRKNQ
jgi:hypothetical protein